MPDKDYMREYMRKRRKDRRTKVIDTLGGRCSKCSTTEDLEINHIDRSSKKLTLSGCGLDGKWDVILEELKNCELLCREHHLEYTAQQYALAEIIPWNKDLHGEFEHGSPRMYNEMNCRCASCKHAKRLYRNHFIGYSDVIEV